MLIEAVDDHCASRIDRIERVPIQRFKRQVHRARQMLICIDRSRQHIDELRAFTYQPSCAINVDSLAHGTDFPNSLSDQTKTPVAVLGAAGGIDKAPLFRSDGTDEFEEARRWQMLFGDRHAER